MRRHGLPDPHRENGRLLPESGVKVALQRFEGGVVVALQAVEETFVQACKQGDRDRADYV